MRGAVSVEIHACTYGILAGPLERFNDQAYCPVASLSFALGYLMADNRTKHASCEDMYVLVPATVGIWDRNREA
jgi:hypothetical protein